MQIGLVISNLLKDDIGHRRCIHSLILYRIQTGLRRIVELRLHAHFFQALDQHSAAALNGDRAHHPDGLRIIDQSAGQCCIGLDDFVVPRRIILIQLPAEIALSRCKALGHLSIVLAHHIRKLQARLLRKHL